MAALIWRLPPRSSRWRSVRPELTGMGDKPAARASLASLEKRAAPAISPTRTASCPAAQARATDRRVPLQRVVQGARRPDQPLAIVDQQPKSSSAAASVGAG